MFWNPNIDSKIIYINIQRWFIQKLTSEEHTQEYQLQSKNSSSSLYICLIDLNVSVILL